MPVYVQLFNGEVLQFPDDTPREVVDRVAQQEVERLRPPEPAVQQAVPQPVAPRTERTWGEAFKDVGAGVVGGVGNVLAFPGQVAQLIPGLREAGQALSAPGEAVSRYAEDLKSEGLKVREALRSQAISDAEKEGMLSAFATAITTTLKDPALISTFLSEQVPLLLPPLAAARITQMAGRSSITAATRGLSGDAARVAAEEAAQQVNRRAYAAAVGTGAAMQGADISSGAYQRAYQAAIQQGMTPEEAADAATGAARIAGAGAFGTSLVTQRLPGARAIEERFARLPGTSGRIRAGVGEATSEGLEEAGGALFQNLGVRQVDPTVSLTEGVGAAAGLGVLGGGFFGTLLGKRGKESLAPGQREGESLEQTINRLSAERAQLMPQELEQQFPNAQQLIEMVNKNPEQGYSTIVKYIEQLKTQPDSPEKEQALQTAEEIRKRLSVEDIERQIPSQQNVIPDKDLRNLGFSRQDPLYQELVGKDLANPADAKAVVDYLKAELQRENLPERRQTVVADMLTTVDQYLSTMPGSGFYVGEIDTAGVGAGAGVVQQPGRQPATAVGATERDGVAPAGEPVPKPVARTERQQPALVFETSKGSIYAVDADGKTSRTKRSPGRGQNETYPPHEAFYVSTSDADRLLDAMRTPEGRSIRLGYRDGNLFRSIQNRSEIPAGAQPFVAVLRKDTNQLVDFVSAELTPRLGLAPVEKLYTPDGVSSTHIGHPIVKIGKGRQAQVQNPVTEETLAQYGIKPASAVAKRILGKSQDDPKVQEELAKLKPQKPAEKPSEKPAGTTEEVDESLKLDGEAIFGTHKVAGLPIQYMLVKALKLSKDVPQFKSDADENGIVQKLSGKFDWRDLGPLQVWQRMNGDFEIISGRHRFDLAKSNNIQYLPVQIHKEADGFDVIQAKTLDAELNIRDGYGKVKDYVNYFQGTQLTREEAKSRGLLDRDPGKRGFDIANSGSPEIIAAHRANRITDQDAALVANAAPNNARLQAVGLKVLEIDKRNGQAAVNTIKGVKAVVREQGGNEDLFGWDDSAIQEATKLEKIATRKQDELSRRISVLSGVTKNPKIAAQEGIDVKDPEAVKQRIADLRKQRSEWDRWETNPALIAEIRQELGEPVEVRTPASEVRTPASFAQELAEGKKLDADEDVQYYQNNVDAIEAELKKLQDAAAAEAQDQMFSLRPEEMEARYRELEARAKREEPAQPATVTTPPDQRTEAIKARVAEIDKTLTDLLTRVMRKYGLNDVGLELVNDTKTNGQYSNRLIRLASDHLNPVLHLRHESIHALKDLGFFTPRQWDVLTEKARTEWLDTYLKKVPHKDNQSRYDAYLDMFKAEGMTDEQAQEALIEEAIADAFSYFQKAKPPAGLIASILNRINNFFKAIKEFLDVGNLTPDEIFGKIEAGELKPSVVPVKPNSWKANTAEKEKAESYEEQNGIKPYVSEGQITIPIEGENKKLSIKSPYRGRALTGYVKKRRDGTTEVVPPKFNDPLTGLPLNKDGTVTVYLPTTNEMAREIIRTKRIKAASPTANRIYLTNESSGKAILGNLGNIDSPVDGANMMLKLDPQLLHIDQEFPNGRKDFFLPIAEGEAFAQKAAMTKLFTMNLPRDKALSKDTKLTDLERRIEQSVQEYLTLSVPQQKARLEEAQEILKTAHNIGSLLTVNGKLEKTNTGGYGLNNYNGKDVMSMGLGMASAQRINEQKLSTCPNSAMCEGLCLGETSGQNELYGGEGQFRSGPRLAQYLKTEALVQHPEEFSVLLYDEIRRFQKAAVDEDYQPSVRLNVTSDFRPQVFKAIINAFPGVEFYDYTKLPSNTIAPNHHLTYSSTGASQVVNGEVIVNPGSNWKKMVERMLQGQNVAMAFTSKTTMPDFVVDEATGERFQVWNGDNYDARFLDPKPGQPENLLNRGMIIGLTNKDRTTPPDQAAKKYKGFFMHYERSRDGDTLVVPDQDALKKSKTIEIVPKLSIRAQTQTPAFQQWFGDSKVVDENGEPLVVYHGTTADFSVFDTERTALMGEGSWFSAEPMDDFARGEGGNVMPVYLSIQNPKRFAGLQDFRKDKLIADGFDGVIIESPFSGKITAAVAFRPEQIKSAIGNVGTFSSTDPDIRKSLRSELTAAERDLRVRWADSRIEKLLSANAYLSDGREKDTKGFAAGIRPNDFLNATAREEDRQRIAVETGPLDPDRLAQEDQELFLEIAPTNEEGVYQIKNHEGRHRMTALMNAGYNGRIPVVLLLNRKNAETEEEVYLRPQQFRVDKELITAPRGIFIPQMIPINWEQRKELREVFGGEADLKFSLRSQTQTPAFKQWFGDSKVVDKNGEPLVMYHGTSAKDDFSVFSKQSHFGTAVAANQRVKDRPDGPARVYPVFLSVQNPLRVSDVEASDEATLLNAIKRGKYKDIDLNTANQKGAVEALKEAGYDGLVYKNNMEDRGKDSWVAFSPTQIKSAIGNVGTFSPIDPDIRKSLRSPQQSLRNTLPANVWDRVDDTIGVRDQKSWPQRIMDAISPSNWSTFRENALNRYNELAVYDREYIRRNGGARLMADESAEAAALMSDLGAGLTAAAFGVNDRIGGVPVYRNGLVRIENMNGTVKGPLAIFAPLAQYKNPEVYRLYQFWSTAQRGQRLNAEGKLTPFTPADMQAVRAIEAQYPEFRSIHNEWIKYNDGLVDFMKQAGVITPEMADAFRMHGDYFPMYKYMEDDVVTGPKTFTSIANVPIPKKFKGDDVNPMGDFFENVVRNTQAAIQAGIKNIAAQKATKVAMAIGQVRPLGYDRPGPNGTTVFVPAKPAKMLSTYYRVLENGEERYYAAADMKFINAIKALNIPDLPFIGFLAGPANVLRNLVTKTPDFMMANMLRDSLSAWATSGTNILPIVSTIRNFGKAIANKSPELDMLVRTGAVGGYDYSQGVEMSAKIFAQDLRKVAGARTTMENIARPATSVWEALEKGSAASDAATRMEVYKKVLDETGNEAEAVFRALEVMNFNRKGRSAIVRILTAAVPFLNARMQGLDVLYRAGIRPIFAKDATPYEQQIAKSFWVRGMTIMALSAMYWAMTHDDDEYKKQEQETRDNYWLIPSMGIKIPIPFEVGVMFKVIPERVLELSFGSDTGKDFVNSMARQLTSTFAFNPIPQTFLPIVEAATNYSFFTQRPIIGQGLENIAAPYQAAPTTSRTATGLADAYNAIIDGLPANVKAKIAASPMIVDQLIQGYTGSMGMYAVMAIDGVISANSDIPNATKRFEQMPVIRRFAIDPQARGTVTSFYDLKNSIDQVVRTANLLERTGKYDEYVKYVQENAGALSMRGYVNSLEKTMKEMREMKTRIRSSTIDADTKRDQLTAVQELENSLTSNIQTVKKTL